MKNNQFKNQWCVVTGASSGIGESFARLLASHGANLILVARRKERLLSLKEELQKTYQIEVDLFSADISDLSQCDALFEYATKDNRKIQMLINNAGRGVFGPFLSSKIDDYLQMIQLNIVSLTKLTHLFTSHMKTHGLPSHVANVASIASYISLPRFSAYAGSKKYVRDFTETLNYEFRNSNIHFTCINPGGTWTEFMDVSGQKMKKSANPFMMTPHQVASIALKGMINKKHSVITGWLNRLICIIPNFLPTKIVMAIGDQSMAMTVDEKS
jgi:uncharacterized protein